MLYYSIPPEGLIYIGKGILSKDTLTYYVVIMPWPWPRSA
jgi:hypothetical protein